MKDYQGDFLARAAAEVENLPRDSAVIEMLSDYAVVRDQLRACE